MHLRWRGVARWALPVGFLSVSSKTVIRNVDPGVRGQSPRKKIYWVVFGGIMVSGFAVHGIGFFGPWFSNSGIRIRVSEVG